MLVISYNNALLPGPGLIVAQGGKGKEREWKS